MVAAVDVVALIVAVIVGLTVVVPVVSVAFGRQISDARAEMIRGILIALIAILSTYVGARLDVCAC